MTRARRLLGASLITLLALGAMTASAAASKTVLVLKEEGRSVAVGAELGVELETGACKLTQRAHVSLNGAKKDRIAVPAGYVECGTSQETSVYLSPRSDEVTLAASSTAILIKAPLVGAYHKGGIGPEYDCVYEVKRFFGTFPVPGHAVIEGSAPGKRNRQRGFESYPGQCAHLNFNPNFHPNFRITVTGHNNKPLETQLTTHR